MKSIGIFATQQGGLYIGKLCRHFAHKIQTEYTANEGIAHFPTGTCRMEAQASELIFKIDAKDAESCTKIQGVIDRHLVKFAYKEPYHLTWEDAKED